MPILDISAPPTYQRIAGKAAQLRELGLGDSAIARRLSVSDKTVAKAIGWVQGLGHELDSQERGLA